MSLDNLKKILSAFVSQNDHKMLSQNEREIVELAKSLNAKIRVSTISAERLQESVYKADRESISFAPQGGCACCGR